MAIVRKILAVLGIVISAIFFVVLVGGIIGVWAARAPIVAGVDALMSPIIYVAQSAQEKVAGFEGVTRDLRSEIDALKTQISQLENSPQEQAQLRQEISATVASEIGPYVTELRTTVVQVSHAITSLDQLVNTINALRITHVDLPGTKLLNDATATVNTLDARLQALRAAERPTEGIQKLAAAAGELVDEVNRGVTEIDTVLSDIDARLNKAIDGLHELRQEIVSALTWISIAISFVLGWLAAGQVFFILYLGTMVQEAVRKGQWLMVMLIRLVMVDG